jgi:hypothetical protein
MDPKILEGLLALPDISHQAMRGHRPDSNKPKKGDVGFVEASPQSRENSPQHEASLQDARIRHDRKVQAAYNRYKAKHPKTRLSLAEFTDQKYNNQLRIPGGKRDVSKRRNQPVGYLRETETIKENKKTHAGTVHKFTPAKWTHPNGHPRCLLCGDEQPISPECGRDATPEEEAKAMQEIRDSVRKRIADPKTMYHALASVVIEKGPLNPFWDGDGVQGVGQPRDHHGRWTRLPGKHLFSKIGVFEHTDGSFGVYHDKDQLLSNHKTFRSAMKKAAKIFEEDRGNTGKSKTRRSNPWDHIKFKPLQGRPHKPLGPDGKPLAKKNYTPEQAAYLRNNGKTKITNRRLAELHKDRTLATQQERDLLLSAVSQKHIDGDEPVRIWIKRRQHFGPRPRYTVMSDVAKEIANDEHRKRGIRGEGGQVIRHTDEKAQLERKKANIKNRESGRNKWESMAKRQWLLDEFGDGTHATCVICGDKRRRLTLATVSPERLRPGGQDQSFGGVYEEGNVAPSHWSCNTDRGTDAQHRPQEYYEANLRRFLSIYGYLFKERKDVGQVIKKHRRELKKLGLL